MSFPCLLVSAVAVSVLSVLLPVLERAEQEEGKIGPCRVVVGLNLRKPYWIILPRLLVKDIEVPKKGKFLVESCTRICPSSKKKKKNAA